MRMSFLQAIFNTRTTNTIAAAGPNPWKVVLILEKLQLHYEIKTLTFPESKQQPFLSINPNGKVPGRPFHTISACSLFSY